MASRHVLAIILSMVLLNSCASVYRYTLEPERWDNPSDWVAESDSAIVFVGVTGDAPIEYLDVNGSDLRGYGYLQNHDLNAIAVHVRAGGEFEVTRASLGYTGPGSYLSETFFKFDGDLPTIAIKGPGLYLYGTILVEGDLAYFTDQNRPQLIAAARRDHPTVFMQLAPVNF